MGELLRNVGYTFDLVKRSFRYGKGRWMTAFFLSVFLFVNFAYGSVLMNRVHFGFVLNVCLIVFGTACMVIAGSNVTYIRDRLNTDELKWKLIAGWVIVTFVLAAFCGLGTMMRFEGMIAIGIMTVHMMLQIGKENAKYNRTRLYRVK